MDTTQTEALLIKLQQADPAEAADIADELTAQLADQLERAAAPPPEQRADS